MKCAHCQISFHPKSSYSSLGGDINGNWRVIVFECPECERFNIFLENYSRSNGIEITNSNVLVYPRSTGRLPCPLEVPKEISIDYEEACKIINDSPKASAALSRRCLQYLLINAAKVKEKDNLANQIQEIIDSGTLPTHLAESIDAVRNIGNFAAHPLKSMSSGQIVEIEEGEAEWNLEILEMLFDFYYVKPAAIKIKKDLLNKKLTDAGKKPMK